MKTSVRLSARFGNVPPEIHKTSLDQRSHRFGKQLLNLGFRIAEFGRDLNFRVIARLVFERGLIFEFKLKYCLHEV